MNKNELVSVEYLAPPLLACISQTSSFNKQKVHYAFSLNALNSFTSVTWIVCTLELIVRVDDDLRGSLVGEEMFKGKDGTETNVCDKDGLGCP